MSIQELKMHTTKKLKKLGSKLNQFDRMQIAINLKIALATVNRYMSGDKEEVRTLELAESIINEADKILHKPA